MRQYFCNITCTYHYGQKLTVFNNKLFSLHSCLFVTCLRTIRQQGGDTPSL